jgi:hypothetical protein
MNGECSWDGKARPMKAPTKKNLEGKQSAKRMPHL